MTRAVLGLLAALSLAATGVAADEIFERSVPLAAGGTFMLTNVNGSVHVDAWDKNQVEIRAVKYARRNTEDLGRVQIDFETLPGVVRVRTRYPQHEGVEVTVDYQVRVPARVVLSAVETVNGTVRVSGVEGSGELRSVNGNVEMFEGSGHFSARTTNSNVRLELRRLADSGSLALETVNGSVVLALPAGSQADLDVRSLNGDFFSELPVTVLASQGAHGLRGRLGRGGSTVRLRTVNGGVRVIIARPTV